MHGSNQGLPNLLRRRFRVYLKPSVKSEMRDLRSIRAADIGHLVTFKVNIFQAGFSACDMMNSLKGHMHSRRRRQTIDRSRLLDV